jgi:hypothetical protein
MSSINPALLIVAIVALLTVLILILIRISRSRDISKNDQGGTRITLLPKTSSGKWSLSLAIIFVLGSIFAQLLSDSKIFDQDFDQSIAIPVTLLLICLAAATVIVGLIGTIKQKERSLLVILGVIISTWIGLISTVGSIFME